MPSEEDIVSGSGGVDAASVGTGAAGGAAVGASVGNIFPGVGTAVGAVVGGVVGAGIGALNPVPVRTPAGPQETTLQNWNSIQRRDYLSRFRPREDLLIKYATDAKAPMRAAQEAGGLVNSAYSDVGASQQRRLARQGVIQTPEQIAAQGRRTEFSKGLATVGAMNTAARRTYDRQTALLSGGTFR